MTALDQALATAANANPHSGFIQAMLNRSKAGLDFSPRMAEVIFDMAQKANRSRVAIDQDMCAEILMSMVGAKRGRKSKVMLRLGDSNTGVFTLKFMSSGKNAGGCWITNETGELIGKVSSDATGEVWGGNAEAIANYLSAAAESGLADLAAEFGKEFGQCSCCGAMLTNPESIERGIGPICAEKYGFA